MYNAFDTLYNGDKYRDYVQDAATHMFGADRNSLWDKVGYLQLINNCEKGKHAQVIMHSSQKIIMIQQGPDCF